MIAGILAVTVAAAYASLLYRGAAVVADSALTVLCLSPQAIATLEQNQPQLAIRLHQAVATVLAQRLLATNQSLQAAIA